MKNATDYDNDDLASPDREIDSDDNLSGDYRPYGQEESDSDNPYYVREAADEGGLMEIDESNNSSEVCQEEQAYGGMNKPKSSFAKGRHLDQDEEFKELPLSLQKSPSPSKKPKTYL